MCLLSLAGTAAGQVQQGQRVYEVDRFDYDSVQSTAPSLGVGQQAAVVAGSHGIVLYNKAGGVEDSEFWETDLPFMGYPFAPAFPDIGAFRFLIHPQAEYDPISGRLWMLYSENRSFGPEEDWKCVTNVHMAVNKDPVLVPVGGTIDTLSDTHWWYYTGRTAEMTQGNGGVAFDFEDDDITSFRTEPVFINNHRPTDDTVRFPSMGFDEDAIIVAFGGNGMCVVDTLSFTQYIYIIPRQRDDGMGGVLEFVDGERASEDDFISINMRGAPIIFDDSVQGRVAQEPFEQYANTTLIVSTQDPVDDEGDAVLQDGIRIKGVFFDDRGTPSDPSDDRWEVRQRLKENMGTPQWEVLDMDVSSLGLGFFRADSTTSASYPDAFGFSPTVEEDMFTSAVLTEDASGNPRVFAVHAVLPDDGTGNPDDHWVVQWYVIDPELGDFFTPAVLSEDWRPMIIDAGRIEVEDADCYHPVLGVSKDGLMTIEYTYSSSTDEQEIRRARFNSSYAITGTTTLRTGPSEGYSGTRWALYGDLQFDPVIGQGICDRLWSTHTLVEEAATSNTDIRDVWLFRQNQSTGFCFQTDMNQSGSTDTYDMMMYTDYYMAGDERADTDADGQVDAIDMLNFVDAYDAATGP